MLLVDELASSLEFVDNPKANNKAGSKCSEFNKGFQQGDGLLKRFIAVFNKTQCQTFPVHDKDSARFKPFQKDELANQKPLQKEQFFN